MKPIHSELLSRTERSITIGDTNFPQPDSKDTRVHFASMLTTDNNPTADDIDHGNKISNTVLAADLNTFSFYDCVEKYKDCKFFLSVKGVSIMSFDVMLYLSYGIANGCTYASNDLLYLYIVRCSLWMMEYQILIGPVQSIQNMLDCHQHHTLYKLLNTCTIQCSVFDNWCCNYNYTLIMYKF